MMQTHLQNRNKLRKWIYGYGVRGRGDRLGIWDWHVHTAVFKADNNKDLLLYSTGNSAQYSVIT